MSFYKNVFLDAAGLERAAHAHAENAFLVQAKLLPDDASPMPLLYLDKRARYIVRLRDDGMIVAAATLYDEYAAKDATTVGQVSTRIAHKRHGHSSAILHDIFHQAAGGGKTLYLTPFEAEGALACAAVLAVHGAYPSVPVLYSGQPAPITAHRRYSLEITPFGVVPRV